MRSFACDAAGAGDRTAALPRSLLFVPGDSERKLDRCLDAGADALVLDLEDAVAPPRKAAARMLVTRFLQQHAGRPDRPALWVRINPAGAAETEHDLESLRTALPDGLVVPKVSLPRDLLPLATTLDELERWHRLPAGNIALLPICTETPASLFTMGGYLERVPRVVALTWGAEDLSAALGASETIDDSGDWLPTYQLARSLCLAAAHAVGIGAIDTVFAAVRDTDGLRRQANRARRDGFTGKLAIHPGQVGIINEAFQPAVEEVDHARRVIAAFNADTGVAELDGRMLDRPHLAKAQRVLALHRRLTDRAD